MDRYFGVLLAILKFVKLTHQKVGAILAGYLDERRHRGRILRNAHINPWSVVNVLNLPSHFDKWTIFLVKLINHIKEPPCDVLVLDSLWIINANRNFLVWVIWSIDDLRPCIGREVLARLFVLWVCDLITHLFAKRHNFRYVLLENHLPKLLSRAFRWALCGYHQPKLVLWVYRVRFLVHSFDEVSVNEWFIRWMNFIDKHLCLPERLDVGIIK